MGVLSFICKLSGSSWEANCISEGHTDLSVSAASQSALEDQARTLAIQNSSGGGVSVSFNYVTPKSAVLVVAVGVAAAAGPATGGAAGGGGGAAAAAAEPEAKKEESEEESDMSGGMNLFGDD